MALGKFCNREKINTLEQLQLLLSDTNGKQYYKEMEDLDVDTELLWKTIQKTIKEKSRIKTWLEICAHCGMCAESCFLYLANNNDPEQVPSYKIQSTMGEIVKKKGQVSTAP